MKCLFAGVCALALLFLISPQPLAQAQIAAETRTARPFTYDVTQEVTLSGTVSSVLTKPAAGMIMGSHLLLATPSGPVDASLGRFGLLGKGAVSVTAGQQIEVTGVMKTLNDKQVLLVRTVKTGGQIYTIRNQHGFPVPPTCQS